MKDFDAEEFYRDWMATEFPKILMAHLPAAEPTAGTILLAGANAQSNPLTVTTCDRCGCRLDVSGEPMLRAVCAEQSRAVCAVCRGSLELLLIDDRIVSFEV